MSSAPRYSAYFDFYFNVVQQGPGPGMVFQQLIGQQNNYMQVVNNINKANQSASQGMRRLALDLRLVSSSLRYIVREMNLQDTAVGKVVTGLGVLTSSLTLIISAQNAFGAILGALNIKVFTFSAFMTAATASVKAFLIAIAPLIAAIVAITLAWYALSYAFESTTGITDMREQIKALEGDLKLLASQMRNVRVEQAALNVSSAALAAEQAAVTAQFKQGMITEEEYEKRIATITINQAALAAQSAESATQQAFLNFETTQGKDAQEDYKEAIKKTYQAATEGAKGTFGGPGAAIGIKNLQQRASRGLTFVWEMLQNLLPGAQQGGMIARTGPIFAHAGESIIPRGETMGGLSLTISLAGAQIYGREGLEEALESGGAKIVKQLQYMRRPRVRW